MTTANMIRLEQLESRIRSVWTREQTRHLAAGLFSFVRWLIPLFLLGMLIDWVTYMPVGGRVVILLVILSVSLFRAWRAGWRELRPFNIVHTALQLESRHGELKSLLVSAIQLRDKSAVGDASASLRDHTCRMAEQAAASLRPEQAVPYKPLQKPLLFAAAFLLILGIFAGINGTFLKAGVLRLFTPWVAIEYPTDTQIELAQEELVIKEGDSALITASLSGVVPDQATIYVRTGEGKARAIDLEVKEDACVYEIASASRDFTYRIKAGDDRTAWQSVRVVPAPGIESVKVDLAYPAYLGRDKESIEALTLTVPEGTGVAWQIVMDRPLKSVAFNRDGQEPLDLSLSEDGRTITFREEVLASQGYQFTWVDQEHGFAFTSPRYFLQVSSDQAPRVELTSPATNLVAMLGRPLPLKVRVQDDHGIGASTIAYRVNQRDENTAQVEPAVQNAPGEQAIDWDYRQAVSDLQIGDTLSLTVRVSDLYPSPQGPHVVRSETRRITFLSKEQYLEQIEKQVDRLLSRVQTIYRQQRSAHVGVVSLSPETAGYIQACQLEAIRQEMIRDQLKEIAGQMHSLLKDLEANSVSEADVAKVLTQTRSELIKIADEPIAQAATLLREESGKAAAGESGADPSEAAGAVNLSARELASLVLRRGIDAAQEVYARETRMLAQVQASVRWQTVGQAAGKRAKKTADQQAELAEWNDRLRRDLQQGIRYDKRPLAVLRLIRSIKELHASKASERMLEASSLIKQQSYNEASIVQAEVLRSLLDAEFSVRLSGAYSTLVDTKRTIAAMSLAQRQLRQKQAGLSVNDFKEQSDAIAEVQSVLRQQLITLLLPSVPAPRAELFDATPPQAPPIDRLLREADLAMRAAIQSLEEADQASVDSNQVKAERLLGELLVAVDRWSVEVGLQTQGLSTFVAATSDRIGRLESYEAEVIALLEKTDIAAADGEKVDSLVDAQGALADDIAAFIDGLERQNADEPDRDLPPLLNRLAKIERSLRNATQSLQGNDADQAIGYQEQAADGLAEAYAMVVAQNERLSLLQSLLMFQRSVGFASTYMADMVAEQRDLLDATEAVNKEEMAVLLPRAAHLRQCMEDIAPLLDLIAVRLDVGTPLAFAKTDFDDAMISMQSGDQFDAIDAQDVAAESLGNVQGLVRDIKDQTGYVAEIIEFLHRTVSDTALLKYDQQLLIEQAKANDDIDLTVLLSKQKALAIQVNRLEQKMILAAGEPKVFVEPEASPIAFGVKPEPVEVLAFSLATAPSRAATKALEAEDVAKAAEEMKQVVTLFSRNAESMLSTITMLHGLPQVELNSQSDPALVRLVDVLAVASDFKTVFRRSQVANEAELSKLAEKQAVIAGKLKELAKAAPVHPLLTKADHYMSQAVQAIRTGDRAALRTSQRAVDTSLRHFIVEQALILETAKPIAASSDAPAADGPGSDAEADVTAGFIADFVSGETPQDKRTEWKVFADRNRAALNQNFARELPLEYRGLLKNYYERVAK